MTALFRRFFLPNLIFLFYSALKLTWRIRIVESDSMKLAMTEGAPMVLAHWHGDELAIVHLLGPYKSCAMVSTSRDGELMDAVARKFGARTSRGSSTRGAVGALKGLIRMSREGWRPSIAVDGPKGPIYKVKPGVFEISKLTGAKIFPLGVACDRKYVFERAWNKSFIPLPFAKMVFVWADGLPSVPRDADGRDPKLAEGLEKALTNARQQARNLIAAL